MKKVNVILGRGLLGKVYSQGMDVLGAKVAKIPGVDFVSVEDYTSWRSIRDRIPKYRDPTILVGHSFFANAITIIASQLSHIQFPLLLTVDPSPYWSWSLFQSGPDIIGQNVARTVNQYQTSGLIGRVTLQGRGVVNVPISSTHTQIDDSELVHQRAIDEIKKVIGA